MKKIIIILLIFLLCSCKDKEEIVPLEKWELIVNNKSNKEIQFQYITWEEKWDTTVLNISVSQSKTISFVTYTGLKKENYTSIKYRKTKSGVYTNDWYIKDVYYAQDNQLNLY